MPYKVIKKGNGYFVKNTDTGKLKSKKPFPTKRKALAQMKALYANVNENTDFDQTVNSYLNKFVFTESPDADTESHDADNTYTVYYTKIDNDPFRNRNRQDSGTAYIQKKTQIGGVIISDDYGRVLKDDDNVKTSKELIEILTKTLGKDVDTIVNIDGGLTRIKRWWDGELITIGGRDVDVDTLKVVNIDRHDYPDFSDAYINYGKFINGPELDDMYLDQLNDRYPELVNKLANDKYIQRDFGD